VLSDSPSHHWFQQLYDRYIEGCLHEKVAEGNRVPEQERHAIQDELLRQFTVMVGAERTLAPLAVERSLSSDQRILKNIFTGFSSTG
jgi:hypothetical protein